MGGRLRHDRALQPDLLGDAILVNVVASLIDGGRLCCGAVGCFLREMTFYFIFCFCHENRTNQATLSIVTTHPSRTWRCKIRWRCVRTHSVADGLRADAVRVMISRASVYGREADNIILSSKVRLNLFIC